jgi:hypothetical protein
VERDETSRTAIHSFLLLAAALAIATACGTATHAQDRLDKYQAQYDAEANPVRRAKLLGQMGTLVVARVRSTFKSEQDEKALDILTHYRDEVTKTLDDLNSPGADAVRHPAGFKELQIGLRDAVRQLDDLILIIPVDKRPFFRTVRTDLADTQNKLIDLLFPTSDKGIKKE